MRSILLLNPPAEVPVLRDSFCGQFAKGNYYWPALDLVMMSGTLAELFDVHVLDAVAERMDVAKTRARIEALHPDGVVSMTSAVSWSSDVAFLRELKRRCGVPIVISGDYPRACPQEALTQNSFIDAVVLDFTDSGLTGFLNGDRSAAQRNLLTRADGDASVVDAKKTFFMPVPLHDRFPLKRYHLPQALHHPFALLATDYGCPFQCDFCLCERVGYKTRDLSNLAEELRFLRSLGIRELRIMDTSFGSARDHALEVCTALKAEGRGFAWSCEMRVDAADEALLTVMKDAGCHTVMFGVESASDEVLRQHGKGITVSQVEEAFRRARRIGLRTVAYFILGLPGEDAASLEKTVSFSLALDPDFASFQVPIPFWNTSLRDEVAANRWLAGNGVAPYSPDYLTTWQSPALPCSEIQRIRTQAERRFYLRLSYIFRQLVRVQTPYQLSMLARGALRVLRDGFARAGGEG